MESEESAQGSRAKAKRPDLEESDPGSRTVERKIRFASGLKRDLLSLRRMRALLDLGLMVNE